MHKRILIWCWLLALGLTVASASAQNPLNTAADASYLSPMEKEIVHELNVFRSNPPQYAKEVLEPLLSAYSGKVLYFPGDKPIRTQEGVTALKECIEVLKKASPLPLFTPSKILTKAARLHQEEQSRTGRTGHFGGDRSGLRERIEKYGKWHFKIGENIGYGSSTARQTVVFLLVDDGVPDRGHRENLLHPAFRKIGVACGTHPVYRHVCVMDFAYEVGPYR